MCDLIPSTSDLQSVFRPPRRSLPRRTTSSRRVSAGGPLTRHVATVSSRGSRGCCSIPGGRLLCGMWSQQQGWVASYWTGTSHFSPCLPSHACGLAPKPHFFLLSILTLPTDIVHTQVHTRDPSDLGGLLVTGRCHAWPEAGRQAQVSRRHVRVSRRHPSSEWTHVSWDRCHGNISITPDTVGDCGETIF